MDRCIVGDERRAPSREASTAVGSRTTSSGRSRAIPAPTDGDPGSRADDGVAIAVHDVVIVGAGLAGLVSRTICLSGRRLSRAWRPPTAWRPGPLRPRRRVRARPWLPDPVTAYPQVRQRLDLDALDLGYFEPGAVVRVDGGFHRVSDPRRRPFQIPGTLMAPIGTLSDKARLARMVLDVRVHSVPTLLRRPETTTAQRFGPRPGSRTGWSSRSGGPCSPGSSWIRSSRCRAGGSTRSCACSRSAPPASRGMGAIPEQLHAALPDDTVRLGARVARVSGSGVMLADNEPIDAQVVVVATDGPTAHRLLGDQVPDPDHGPWRVAGSRFRTPRFRDPVLVLDGEASGPVKNLAVMSNVAPSYAPAGRALVAARCRVRSARPVDRRGSARPARRWFGSMTRDWEHLRTDVIAHGQPLQRPPFDPKQPIVLGDGRLRLRRPPGHCLDPRGAVQRRTNCRRGAAPSPPSGPVSSVPAQPSTS